MRLRAGGLLWMAPVCSSFVFANSVKCLRQAPDFEGDIEYGPVRGGNLMAQVSVFFMLLAAKREIYAGMENPAGSTIFSFKPVQEILETLQVVYQTTDSCAFSPLPFGKRSLKRFKVAGSGAWIQGISRKCCCPTQEGGGTHVELMTTGPDGRVSGTPALKLSQAYSKAFGTRIIRVWEDANKTKLPPCQVSQAVRVSKSQPNDSRRQDHKSPANLTSWTPDPKSTGLKRSASPSTLWTSPFNSDASSSSTAQLSDDPTSTSTSPSPCTSWTTPFTPATTASKRSRKAATSSPEDWQTVGTIE